MIHASRTYPQFVLSGKFIKSAHFLLSSNLLSQHILSSDAMKENQGFLEDVRVGSEFILPPFPFQLSLQHPSQRCLMSFPKHTQQHTGTALCHCHPPAQPCWKSWTGKFKRCMGVFSFPTKIQTLQECSLCH